MRPSALTTLATTVLLLATGTGMASSQTTYPNIKVSGRLQEQFYYFDNDA